jgi:hypothetical protein
MGTWLMKRMGLWKSGSTEVLFVGDMSKFIVERRMWKMEVMRERGSG